MTHNEKSSELKHTAYKEIDKAISKAVIDNDGNTKTSLTDEEIEWLEFGFEEWVDVLEQIDGGWENKKEDL